MHARGFRGRIAPTFACAALAVTVGVAGLQSFVGTAPVGATQPTPTYETPVVPDAAYSPPAGALYVSLTGSDWNSGSASAPFATVKHAVAMAPTGGTVVVHRGTYREGMISMSRRITVQAYPHEQVWINGSTVMAPSVFHLSGGAWVTTWRSPLVAGNPPAGVVAPSFPAAAMPEQVYFDHVPLQQVTSAQALGAGRFYVNRSGAGQLELGSDPTGRLVAVTTQPMAIVLAPSAAGSIVRGIGFLHYGPTYSGAAYAMVLDNAANVTFDHDAFAWSAGRGLTIMHAVNVSVLNSVFLYNGLNGIHGHHADGLSVIHTRVAYSNEEHFSITGSAIAAIAAIKVTTSPNVVVRDSLIDDNDSNGVWFDLSAYMVTINGNTVLRNSGQGIFYEVSANAVIAGNVVANNGRNGIELSGSNNISVWNNTMVGNGGAQLGVFEDPRTQPNSAMLKLGITWNAANISIANNVLAASPGASSSSLTSFDASNPKHSTSSAMIAYDDHNLFSRTSTIALPYVVQWQTTTKTQVRYNSLTAVQSGLARERSSVTADNVPLTNLFASPAASDFTPNAGGPVSATGVLLPAAVAAALGVAPGSTPHFGELSVPAVWS